MSCSRTIATALSLRFPASWGLDFLEDSRSFALADIDHDGRLEVILKNRNAPQLRILHNAMKDIGDSIAFRLRGHKSNRDAHRSCNHGRSGNAAPNKISAGGLRVSCPALQRVLLWSGKAGRNISRPRFAGQVGSLRDSKALPVNHRIEIEEGSVTFVGQAFRRDALSLCASGAAADSGTVAFSGGYVAH